MATHPDARIPTGMNMLMLMPDDEMYEAACRVLQHSNWHVERASDLAEARKLLSCRHAVAICCAQFPGGTWRDLLTEIRTHGCPVNLVVADRQAGEQFWAQVLDGGGYDVLAYPFDAHELFRVATQAWRHWRHLQEDRSRVPAAMATVSGL